MPIPNGIDTTLFCFFKHPDSKINILRAELANLKLQSDENIIIDCLETGRILLTLKPSVYFGKDGELIISPH